MNEHRPILDPNQIIYKVTVKDREGNEMVAYCLPPVKHRYTRWMMEEYGNADVQAMLVADVPADVNIPR